MCLTFGALAFTCGCTKKTESNPKISGTITLTDSVKQKMKPTDVLYIIARAEQIGPPAAVKRIENPQFPLHYTIGPEDSMMPGVNRFTKDQNITIAARLSKSGNAIAASGDLEGIYLQNPSKPGQTNVDVTIDREH